MRKVLVIYRVNREDPTNFGVIQKMNGIVQGFKANNCEVDYVVAGHRSIYFNTRCIHRFHRFYPWNLMQWQWFNYLKEIDFDHYDAIIVRYGLSTPSFINWLKRIKCKHPKTTIVIELPTYPYEKEWSKNLKGRFLMISERRNTRHLTHLVDRVIHSGEDREIFGVPTVQLGNGITPYKSMPHRSWKPPKVKLVAVGKWAYWHGLDRLIEGIGNYVSDGGRDVFLDIIGEGPIRKTLIKLVAKYDLDEFISFYPSMTLKQLEGFFNSATLGVGTLALFRKHVKLDSSLKHREYVKQGLPFIYAGKDVDIEEHENFVLNIPANNTPVDISRVVSFVKNYNYQSGTVRMEQLLREKLSWDVKVKHLCKQIWK